MQTTPLYTAPRGNCSYMPERFDKSMVHYYNTYDNSEMYLALVLRFPYLAPNRLLHNVQLLCFAHSNMTALPL